MNDSKNSIVWTFWPALLKSEMIVIYFDKIHGLIRINESTTLFPDQPSILQHKPSINFSDQLLKEKKKKETNRSFTITLLQWVSVRKTHKIHTKIPTFRKNLHPGQTFSKRRGYIRIETREKERETERKHESSSDKYLLNCKIVVKR